MLLTAARWGCRLSSCCWRSGCRASSPTGRRSGRGCWLLVGLGSFGFTVFNVALYSALLYTTAINVSIEQAGMPMLIFLVNFLLFRTAGDLGADRRLPAFHRRRRADGQPWRAWRGLLKLDVNFGDALMLSGGTRLQRLHGGAALQARHPLAKPDDRAVRQRRRHLASLRRRRVRVWRGDPARCPGLGGHRLYAYSSRRSWRRSSTFAASN